MINIDEKMYITKEVNAIVIAYAKEVLLKNFLMEFCFYKPEKVYKKKSKNITALFRTMSYYNGDKPPEQEQLEVIDMVSEFLEKLNKTEMMSLNFLVLNETYIEQFREFEINGENYDENDNLKEETYKFGRYLAQRIYWQDNSGLKSEVFQYFINLTEIFSSENDLSLVDKYSTDSILDLIKLYTKK